VTVAYLLHPGIPDLAMGEYMDFGNQRVQWSMDKLHEWWLLIWVSIKQYLQALWEPGHW
jgi:hypothetical protein